MDFPFGIPKRNATINPFCLDCVLRAESFILRSDGLVIVHEHKFCQNGVCIIGMLPTVFKGEEGIIDWKTASRKDLV